ncbi:MAG: Transcription termination factor NusA [candidate division WWE3 bacterium GW2011_GWB1_41_6]|uniref:Transcription termination factor NusA n=1 Tax=candidate division WWE3 bacterium GW2011_GWB1_41_6 TaxID=1619112 RepID=A0A0G0Z2M4_UNCKA|nr:MAG: Transcription termination factor NusA [candidate division WWE3 bacterium GW2011_GWB1_41_6]
MTEVELDHDERKATVSVPEDQQSLAIGKEGQNARLANKLTKWKIDIKGAPGLFGTVAEAAEVAKGKKIIRGIWDEDIKKAEDLLDEEAEKLAENVAEEIEVAGENTDVPEEKSEQKEPDAKE